MEKKWISVVFLLVLMTFPSIAFSQSAKDALRAMKKLQARTQAGISYNDYAPALGEAKFEINLFLESPAAKENYKFTEAIKNAMKHYENAREVWGCKFAGSLTEVLYPPDYQEVITLILINNPELRPLVIKNSGRLPLQEGVSILWREASIDLEKASRLFSLSSQSSDEPDSKARK